MEFISVGAISSSQLLVVLAFALFATIILASIYIRVRGQYRGRNKLPNHTQRRVFGLRRTKDSNLPPIPKENHEVVSGARRKTPEKDEDEGFQFDFDLPQRPSGPVEHVAPLVNGSNGSSEDGEPSVEIENGAVAEPHRDDVEEHEYEASSQDEDAFVAESLDEHFDPTGVNDVDSNSEQDFLDEEIPDAWDAYYDDEYDTHDVSSDMESSEYERETASGLEEFQSGEYEFGNDVVQPHANEDFESSNEDQVDADLITQVSDAEEVDHEEETEIDEQVVPFDHRASEAKRVGTSETGIGSSFSVVSVCLISEEQGQIFRDIRGEHLAAFLKNRGFIYLDEEYHLQHKSMVDRGAIRVRNYEDISIGTLVRQNVETRGFRLYFRPSDCADPLATLNEMLKVANLAIGFFSDVCSKPLEIYDGRKDSSGNISRLTQEDYNALKRDLKEAFPRNLEEASKRTAITRSEYAPNEDLPTRAEQY